MHASTHQTGTGELKIITHSRSPDELLEKEWLLTNSRAGFAAGTVIGCCTRRYHGLLIGTHTPPANRIAALANCLETVTCDETTIALSTFEFDRTLHPQGYQYQTAFRKNLGVHFDYELGVANLTKSIYLLPDCDVAAVVYAFDRVCGAMTFSVRPFAAMRDFHSLQHSRSGFFSRPADRGVVLIQNDSPRAGQLALRSEGMDFSANPHWWYRFLYRVERFRGQDCFEDLWSPGCYTARIDGPSRVILWAALTEDDGTAPMEAVTLEAAVGALRLREKELLASCDPQDAVGCRLVSAAGQFVVRRSIDDKPAPTLMAGYPWFLDWGRDTFIALEGLCLCTGRAETAWGVLKTFAGAVSEGMIPNRFDDYGNAPHYNSIDASLWFVHAAFAWLDATNDVPRFADALLPAISSIIRSYRHGTRFGIRADSDHLITGGDNGTQLTWMDAKCDGVCFTPRHGKAVEVNALWYSTLRQLAAYCTAHQAEDTDVYTELADRVADSFVRVFWNAHVGYLNDCIQPNGIVDAGLRPNQILAVSLPYSPLAPSMKHSILNAVQWELLTPYGLRTLASIDPRYKGRYGGHQGMRDAAYQQGTVWPWLMGPYIEAYLKVNNFSDKAKDTCRQWLSPLIRHLEQDACIGSISEIFEGDRPHTPRGAFAQAWSVAEVLRAWWLIHR